MMMVSLFCFWSDFKNSFKGLVLFVLNLIHKLMIVLSCILISSSFLEGGCVRKFLIIDDGWQETVNEFCKEGEPFIEGIQ